MPIRKKRVISFSTCELKVCISRFVQTMAFLTIYMNTRKLVAPHLLEQQHSLDLTMIVVVVIVVAGYCAVDAAAAAAVGVDAVVFVFVAAAVFVVVGPDLDEHKNEIRSHESQAFEHFTNKIMSTF